jgi:hypothetical protein
VHWRRHLVGYSAELDPQDVAAAIDAGQGRVSIAVIVSRNARRGDPRRACGPPVVPVRRAWPGLWCSTGGTRSRRRGDWSSRSAGSTGGPPGRRRLSRVHRPEALARIVGGQCRDCGAPSTELVRCSMFEALDGAALRQRRDMYLANQYISLHVTAVSLSLGVAAVVAGSLMAGGTSDALGEYKVVIWLLWLASLLAVAVVYAGPMVGAILLPSRVPAVTDLLLPLLNLVLEFLLFTVLGYRITGWTSPHSVLSAWWSIFAAFTLAGVLSIWRAHHLVGKLVAASVDVAHIVAGHRKRLRSQIAGASAGTALGVFGSCYYLIAAVPRSDVTYALAVSAVLAAVFALIGHRRTANELRRALEQVAQGDELLSVER